MSVHTLAALPTGPAIPFNTFKKLSAIAVLVLALFAVATTPVTEAVPDAVQGTVDWVIPDSLSSLFVSGDAHAQSDWENAAYFFMSAGAVAAGCAASFGFGCAAGAGLWLWGVTLTYRDSNLQPYCRNHQLLANRLGC